MGNGLKNQTKTHKIQNLDKRSFTVINDFLLTNINLNQPYYNLKIGKVKNNLDKMKNIIIKDVSCSTIPRFRLSLLGLLFRNHYFIDDPKIYNLFEISIFMYNFRFQTGSGEIVKI